MPTITTESGHALEVLVSGPTDGVPLLFHHGTPSSAVPLRAFERAAHARGLRFVTYSRPGYAASTRRPGRAVADAADDALAILDHLGATRCLTAGFSGGGPHALATAARLPERVAGALSIAGFMPHGNAFTAGMSQANIDEYELAARGEAALRPELEPAQQLFAKVDAVSVREALAPVLSEVDYQAMTGELATDVAASIAAGMRTSADGWIDDDLALVKPWGIAVEEITVPVFVWQGGQDLMVPFTHGEWLAGAIPSATAHLEPAHGHLSLTIEHDTMLDELVKTL
jgi:pimeloyl-ACP methyl ester carboxylesterase